MLQLLALLCMEPPVTFSADDVRDEKVKVLHAIHAPAVDEVPKWPSGPSTGRAWSGGEEVPGYLEEHDVPADSTTETFAALRLEVDNWRWAGVPIYLRTGKRLARKITEIAVTLKPVPHLAFEQQGSVGVQPNQLIMTMQPNEGVSLSLGAKIPGSRMRIRPVNMEFLYGTAFLSQSPEAYERLITRRHAGRRHALHPRRRGRGAVADLRPDPPGLGQRRPGRCRKYPAGTQRPRGGQRDPDAGGPLAARSETTGDATLACGGVWAAQDTTPAEIEARSELLKQRHAEDEAFAPARVLNLVVIVDREWRGEIINRLEKVGRYHPSRHDPLRGRAGPHAARRLGHHAGGGRSAARASWRSATRRCVVDIGEHHLGRSTRSWTRWW